MRSEDVARYLQDHPEFFEEHADTLAEIHIPHPHGGRAIPISERQIVSLREKNKVLESKLRELVRFGEENDAISEKLHRATLAMIRAPGLEPLLQVIYYNLREDFSVPHVALRLWVEWDHAAAAEFEPVSSETRVFAESLGNPYCCAKAMFDSAGWFGEAGAGLRSFAYIPLQADRVFGLLALGSEDANRFYPDMGTLYLKRLGETIGAALSRQL
jgi:uncharacterized protein